MRFDHFIPLLSPNLQSGKLNLNTPLKSEPVWILSSAFWENEFPKNHVFSGDLLFHGVHDHLTARCVYNNSKSILRCSTPDIIQVFVCILMSS